MQKNTQQLIREYIEQIWNKQDFEKLDDYLHPNFKDLSLPPNFPDNKEGTKQWILTTGGSFEHHTTIEEQVTEQEKSILKIRMHLKHIGIWRNVEPTGIEINAIGYRFFRMVDGRISEHAALIDGQAIENQLRNAVQGCKRAV